MLHFRLRALVWFIVIFLGIYFLYFNAAIKTISTSFPKVYFPDDSETNYMISLIVSRGGGLYKDFSIVYPPGRFLLEGFLFRLFSPTLPLALLYFAFFKILFTVVLFFLSKKIIDQFLQIKNRYRSVVLNLLALVAVGIYMSFINSAQEVHAVVAIFFLVYLHVNRKNHYQFFLLGMLWALVFLFRIDAGILLTVSVFITQGVHSSRKYLFSRHLIAGFLVIWIPILLLIAIRGSLLNFLYDSFYLGLVVQPRMMSLPIPPPPVGKVYWAVMIFILAAGSAMAMHAQKLKDKKNVGAVQAFSLFAILSFTAALGRSDEAHLWYGSVWLSVFITYALVNLTALRSLLTLKKLTLILCVTGVSLILTYALLHFKSPTIYIICAVIIFLGAIKKKTISSLSLLIGGIVAALLVFHSASYVKLIYSRPHLDLHISFNRQLLSSNQNQLAGMTLSNANKEFLNSIRLVLNPHDRSLFIYPDNVIYYEYFRLKNPTRHYYHTGETTEKLQQEIISDLKKSNTTQFLVFPDKVTYKGSVWNWILKNTSVKKTFLLGNLKAVVLVKN